MAINRRKALATIVCLVSMPIAYGLADMAVSVLENTAARNIVLFSSGIVWTCLADMLMGTANAS